MFSARGGPPFFLFPARASFSPPGRSLFVLRLFQWFLSLLGFPFPFVSFFILFFPFLLSDGLRFLLDSLQGSFLFVLVPFFRLFALGSTSFPFPFSLIRPALPFISFVVFGFLSASLHRDAPSGGGDERAAWPRPTPSASVWPSRRTGRASSRRHCVACRRRPCPGPGPA